MKKTLFFPGVACAAAVVFLPPNDKTNDKIKKNFKKWEAPAE
jgi:hypothetical protein